MDVNKLSQGIIFFNGPNLYHNMQGENWWLVCESRKNESSFLYLLLPRALLNIAKELADGGRLSPELRRIIFSTDFISGTFNLV